jgi:hypothetical protein
MEKTKYLEKELSAMIGLSLKSDLFGRKSAKFFFIGGK